jgi:hypothetical protein
MDFFKVVDFILVERLRKTHKTAGKYGRVT